MSDLIGATARTALGASWRFHQELMAMTFPDVEQKGRIHEEVKRIKELIELATKEHNEARRQKEVEELIKRNHNG